MNPALCQYHKAQYTGAGHQETSLDYLDPGGGYHPAQGHVHDHETADASDGVPEGDAEEKLHELTGPDHLGGQVEDGDEHGREGGSRADRPRGRPESEDIPHGVLARVTAGFSHDEEHGHISD